MKRLFLIFFVLTGSFMSSCQCSERPDVPPVDPDRRAAAATDGLALDAE